MLGDPSREPDSLASIRRMLLGGLVLGGVGTGAELILLGHVDEPTQWIPLVLLGLSLPIVLWHVVAQSDAAVRALRLLMAAYAVAGLLGVGLHFRGNAEFESELHPDARGFEWLIQTLSGATPVLAPGSLLLLALVGFAHSYQYPVMTGRDGQEKRS